MKVLLCLLCSMLSAGYFVETANILYLSNVPSPSHFIWCKALLTSLHERGHNITALSPDVEKSTDRFTYYHLETVYSSLYNGSKEINFFEMGQMSIISMFLEFIGVIEKSCVGTLNSKGYQQVLDFPATLKFDLIIYDFTMSQCLLGIVHKYDGVPMVSVTPFLITGKASFFSGSLIFPAFFPFADTTLPQIMTFAERAQTVFQTIFEYALDYYYITPKINDLVQEKHPGTPYIGDVEEKATKLIMVNTQPITDYELPTFQHVKLVGGAQIQTPKPLPVELQEAADAAKNGLVLFSLGTNVRSDTLGKERINKIIKAFGRLEKYTFLWKFETKEKLPIALPKNVIIQPWMPQNDVLAHKNTKLFISHCGLLSTQEALWYGVPVLGFPVFADQIQNAFRIKQLGISETLSVIDFTEEELFQTVKKLLEDSKYQKKIKSITDALHDQPMTPIEEATYWTEWVIRHPDIELRSPSRELGLFVRHSLDIFTAFMAVIALAFLLWFKFMKYLIRACFMSKRVQTDKNKKFD